MLLTHRIIKGKLEGANTMNSHLLKVHEVGYEYIVPSDPGPS